VTNVVNNEPVRDAFTAAAGR